MDKYKITKNLGDGTYGSVAMATNSQNGEVVAIKKMKKKFYSWDECMSLREIKALRKLNHPNIVKMKEVIRVNNDLYLVFEYMQGNVYEMIKDNKARGLSDDQVKSVLFQTLQGLDYMHTHGVFHRDLKPENLLFYNGHVKVADFGLSKDIRSIPPHTDYVSTRWYRAPEILLHSTTYNSPVDIFAMGCIASELFTGQPLFPGRSEQDQLYRLCAVLGKPPVSWQDGYRMAVHIGTNFPNFAACDISKIVNKASPVAIDLIQKMLIWDPVFRPTAKDCLNHPYFADLLAKSQLVEKQVDLQSVPNYIGPNHESQHLDSRNRSMIGNAVQAQMFGEKRDENGFKNDLYHQGYGSKYSDFLQHQQPFQQQSQTSYPKYQNPHSLPQGGPSMKSYLRNDSQPALPKNSNYFEEAVQLTNGRRPSNIFGQNFDKMLSHNDKNYQPTPVLDQRFQKDPSSMTNYQNFRPSGLNTMSIMHNKNGTVDMGYQKNNGISGGFGRF
eukprot:403344883